MSTPTEPALHGSGSSRLLPASRQQGGSVGGSACGHRRHRRPFSTSLPAATGGLMVGVAASAFQGGGAAHGECVVKAVSLFCFSPRPSRLWRGADARGTGCRGPWLELS